MARGRDMAMGMRTDLVRQAMQGNHEAFATLAGQSLARLYGTAGLILGDEPLAAEAVQTTLIRAWRDLPRLRDPGRFDVWLYRLLTHACGDEIRRRERSRQREVDLGHPELPSHSDPTNEIASRDELDRALDRLTPSERAIISLVYFRDFTIQDTAAALGTPVGTAKSRLHRARGALRAALDAERRLHPGEARR